jgi:hypothetical protein
MGLVRTILLLDEEGAWRPDYIDAAAYEHHVRIMEQGGLLQAAFALGSDPHILAITAKGHDFIDLARDEARWNRVTARIHEHGGAPFDIWVELLRDDFARVADTGGET